MICKHDRSFVLYSMDGKNVYPITITRDFRQWENGLCWSFYCKNSIRIVHISTHGNATHGYCFWCFRSAMLFQCLYSDIRSGKWVECVRDYKTRKSVLKERTDRQSFEKQLREKYQGEAVNDNENTKTKI